MADRLSLEELQRGFAAHIRDPQGHAAPADVEDRRMAIYRRLFFNNISNLLASNFPVLHSLYAEPDWQALVRDFYSGYRCQTPLFPEIGKEFLRYLQDGRETQADDPPFMLELAHYEWVELALSLDERDPAAFVADRDGDLLAGRPLLSPLAWPLSYRYPVQRIGPDFRPEIPPEEPTHLLVYRNLAGQVKFMKLNNVTRLLLEFMQEDHDATGKELLERVAGAIGHASPDQVIAAGSVVLDELKKRDVVLGARR